MFSQPSMRNMECTNCNVIGHGYNYCSQPITSFGIILFDKISQKYIMIRRKDSFGFIDFVKGKYSLSNLFHIKNSIDQMSNVEKQIILNNFNNFDNIWFSFYDALNPTYSKRSNNYYNSYKKFEALKKGTIINGRKYTLESLLQDSTTSWDETEWEFPKGRKLKGELDLDCAIREFEEETGLRKENIDILDDLGPYDEIFIGSNHRAYKHKYFVATTNSSCSLVVADFQRTEVSKLEWKSFEECLKAMRPYNYEKKRVLTGVHHFLLLKKETKVAKINIAQTNVTEEQKEM